MVGENVPKPTTVTFRPDRTSEMIVSNKISTVVFDGAPSRLRRLGHRVDELRSVHDHLLSDT